jgi:dynein heavy chain, axonemal
LQSQEEFRIDRDIEYHSLFIPTNESIRSDIFMDFGVRNKVHYLFCGATGTGKTISVKSQLSLKYQNSEYANLTTALSGQTSAASV